MPTELDIKIHTQELERQVPVSTLKQIDAPLDHIGITQICQWIASGISEQAICAHLQIALGELKHWIASDTERKRQYIQAYDMDVFSRSREVIKESLDYDVDKNNEDDIYSKKLRLNAEKFKADTALEMDKRIRPKDQQEKEDLPQINIQLGIIGQHISK